MESRGSCGTASPPVLLLPGPEHRDSYNGGMKINGIRINIHEEGGNVRVEGIRVSRMSGPLTLFDTVVAH